MKAANFCAPESPHIARMGQHIRHHQPVLDCLIESLLLNVALAAPAGHNQHKSN
jgi:hypothetical protein